jgi:hypothetical protein
MKISNFPTIILGLFLLLGLSTQSFSATEVTWNQLAELENSATVPEEIKSLLNKPISVKGFMMPLDYSQKKIAEYLLMPYVPACMHVPPPPANQLILVKMEAGKEVEPSFYPVEVTGTLSVNPSEEFESSYEMSGTAMSELK